jgi:hypothetical protein
MSRALLVWISFIGSCLAVEPPVLPMDIGNFQANGREFVGAKIVAADAVGVKIMHEAGTARIAYDRLPPEIAAKFPRDEAAAEAQKRKEAAEMDAHERETAVAAETNPPREMKPPDEPEPPVTSPQGDVGADAPEPEDEPEPVLDGKSVAERINVLRGYADRLKSRMKAMERSIDRTSERDADKANERRNKYRDFDVDRKTGQRTETTSDADREKMGRIENKSDAKREKLFQMSVQLGKIEAEIKRLQDSLR